MTGLEALETLHTKIGILDTEQDLYNHCLNIIETELKRLENFDNHHCVTLPRMSGKKSLAEDYAEALMILRIIKEKVMPLVCVDDGEVANGHYRVYDAELYMHRELTRTEFDLLKEVLK